MPRTPGVRCTTSDLVCTSRTHGADSAMDRSTDSTTDRSTDSTTDRSTVGT